MIPGRDARERQLFENRAVPGTVERFYALQDFLALSQE